MEHASSSLPESPGIETERQHIWNLYTEQGSVGAPGPEACARTIVRGAGVHVFDLNGKRYLDGLSGLGVVNAGHGRAEIIQAITAQLEQLEYLSPFMGFSHPPGLALAARLAELAPLDRPKIIFVNSGSEAVERAMMIARQYFSRVGQPQRRKIISLRASFHGSTFGGLSASGLPNLAHQYEPMLPGFVQIAAPRCYRCGSAGGEPDCSWDCVRQLEESLAYERPDQVAAILVEPVMNAGGIIVPPDGYLRRVREICDRHGVLLIIDEVLTGFGRTGKMFASEHWGVRPDIMAVAKGLSSGYMPIAAAIAGQDIADAFRRPSPLQNIYQTTFGGHPAACAAALANLDLLEQEHLIEQAAWIGADLGARLAQLREHRLVGDIRGIGAVWGIEIVQDRASKQRFAKEAAISRRLEAITYEHGLICRVAADVIRLFPPLICGEPDLVELCSMLDASLGQLEAELSIDGWSWS